MTLFNPKELRALLKPADRVLGLDPGSRQIGVALSDVSLMLASPLTVLKRGKMAVNVKELAALCTQFQIGALVVGLPMSLDGSFGPAARAASDWAKDISDRLECPAAMWDERLSSSAVNRFLIQEADMTRKRRHEVVDKMAAAYTLQGWLDATAP
ncbi:Holliday junction resolvase RuvX [Oecophyllibacter saccharovorans]|uniref:Putative pre-16S rRNA nuclease n=1 Tax=Oecophyllibacter saccharovorans TaxID=2558360 RepID=A0A506UQE1_9PROT|nr:Holliday junction resolvase RuvX [Oecophyllibacter saccharovorans]TPW34658.1 Holliday junction resolvase RuvX [Oecophyllibacter saccharovorans]TPW35601.1 Holliday junction resolvase RuvX [Oecophyllibacter saccharovorans]